MSKRKSSAQGQAQRAPELFPGRIRKRRALILPRYLKEWGDRIIYQGQRQDEAHEIIKKWAEMERAGRLAKKETSLDAEFLLEVFGRALGYTPHTETQDKHYLERQFTVEGIGTADGAIGCFPDSGPASVAAIIELKDSQTDLDRDKSAGRTAVQQCWDYLNALPECPWGIVSNFRTIRLYHRDKTPLACEEFSLRELLDLERFRQFYCLFEFGGLLRSSLGEPRALDLLRLTENRQREVGGELYAKYNDNRLRLIQHLHYDLGKTLDQSIHIAQKLLDRIIFVAFCEDRGLLPEKCIDTAYKSRPPFSKVTNPRWQNFLNLFHAVDTGHSLDLALQNGYDGGLFRHDPDVDDLQLDDSWTNFFQNVGTYDFREEVNVDVLGHLFEQSITELHRLRTGGLFGINGPESAEGAPPAMKKSAQRKRSGTYYTPPEFTEFIVANTVDKLIEERLATLRATHKLNEEETKSEERSARLANYWRDAWTAVRASKVCDPACGSGAFLIEAYDVLEDRYEDIVERLMLHDGPDAEMLAESIPDLILAENLYGVDLSPQAVEITQLALWIRSARRGRTLADLSHNIVCGNSLVDDAEVDAFAFSWADRFPEVFERGGFDCVIGNPPWERLKLQEREFFATSAPKIAGAVSAADRRRLIAELEAKSPELYRLYAEAKTAAERTLAYARESGKYPLTGRGDINTYMLFAELAQRIVAPNGRVGLLVPSGIATDATTKEFFGQLVDRQALVGLYDFENRQGFFPDVHRSFKFCILLFGGEAVKAKAAQFVFFAHSMDDLAERDRRISLAPTDFALLNPNTRTCPIFRTRRDAELTKAIYRRVPVLFDESRREGGNPWGIRFLTMFHQTNDAELFHTAEQLKELGFKQRGNRWTKGKQTFLPLYEAKMIQAYDHRAASVVLDKENWMRQGQTLATTPVQHQNPEFAVAPRWWIAEGEVSRVLNDRDEAGYIAYKDVTSPTNQRTMIAALVPRAGLVNSAPLVRVGDAIAPRAICCLLANLNVFAFDFVARQKVGGVHLNFFIVNQLPIFPPDRYSSRCPWNQRQTLERWISDRVLKLTCTADDMRPFAEAAGFDPPVHKWRDDERAALTAELDAAYFLLYGIARADAQYILSMFQGTSRTEELFGGASSTADLVMRAYDRLSGHQDRAED